MFLLNQQFHKNVFFCEEGVGAGLRGRGSKDKGSLEGFQVIEFLPLGVIQYLCSITCLNMIYI